MVIDERGGRHVKGRKVLGRYVGGNLYSSTGFSVSNEYITGYGLIHKLLSLRSKYSPSSDREIYQTPISQNHHARIRTNYTELSFLKKM
jgi:hypothetical protein